MRFGRYTLERRIGTGGMAEIWKASISGPEGFAKTLAVKKVRADRSTDSEVIEMFVQEAKLVAELVHPNIVQVFDFGREGREYFLAMEYVAGVNLARLLKLLVEAGRELPAECALYIAAEAAKGLHYAHTKSDAGGRPLGIVHRDVSPQNVLVSFGGEVKVADFGIARLAGVAGRTATGFVRGKLAYLSPEQVRASGTVDSRADLFSLGLVFYELLTGRRLHGTMADPEILRLLLQYSGPSDEDLAAVPGNALRTMLRKILQPDPRNRFRTGLEIENAIASLLSAQEQMQARRTLATVVRRLFEDEWRAEVGAAKPPAPPTPSEETSSPSSATQLIAHLPKSPAGPPGLALEVIVDGEVLVAGAGLALEAGRYSLRFVDMATGFEAEEPLDLPRRAAIRIFVDTKTRRIDVTL